MPRRKGFYKPTQNPVVREIDKFGNDVRRLSDTQLRALSVLARFGAYDLVGALSLEQLARGAGISDIVMRRAVGNVDPNCRESGDKVACYRSLLSRGDVRVEHVEVNDRYGIAVYYLTPSGVATLEAVNEAIAVLGPPKPNYQKKE